MTKIHQVFFVSSQKVGSLGSSWRCLTTDPEARGNYKAVHSIAFDDGRRLILVRMTATDVLVAIPVERVEFMSFTGAPRDNGKKAREAAGA